MDAKAIAMWRYEQIEEALPVRAHDVRGPLLRRRSEAPVTWPFGHTRPISLATLYRWIEHYEDGGLVALQPAVRKDRGKKRARVPKDVVEKAFALWADDPDLSFTMLEALLHADPLLRLEERGIRLARSTLQRRLAAHPLYARLKRTRKRERQRRRYVARRPHEIWHLDAKGPVTVRLTSGERTEFHVVTVLDDASRDILSSIVVKSPDLCAAVRVFRRAAKRWGLPDLIYADRASIFDSVAFRGGLAQLGTHRIRVKPRNPQANGKIEAFHRVLVAWYTGRLFRQQVIDLVHLEQLLWGVLETVYRPHHHRGLKCSPKEALGEQISSRTISAQRLEDAFRQERALKAHAKTGEVDLSCGTFIVPDRLRGQRLRFLVDPEPEVPPRVVDPVTGRTIPLERAAIRPEDRRDEGVVERWGKGPLQMLYDAWQGKVRPNAEPGFGLPEIFMLFSRVAGRPVPRSDAEAALIQRVYAEIGPLPKKATEDELRRICRELGKGRPITSYLDALKSRVRGTSQPKKKRRK
jgi:transposase InsO family protein